MQDQIYIKSAVSDDVDLCLECFSVGIEIKDPRRTGSSGPCLFHTLLASDNSFTLFLQIRNVHIIMIVIIGEAHLKSLKNRGHTREPSFMSSCTWHWSDVCLNCRVMERLDFPIITPEWTAREELSLLEGIETYGIGNWADVRASFLRQKRGRPDQKDTDVDQKDALLS